jgi:hypothetical protein
LTETLQKSLAPHTDALFKASAQMVLTLCVRPCRMDEISAAIDELHRRTLEFGQFALGGMDEPGLSEADRRYLQFVVKELSTAKRRT